MKIKRKSILTDIVHTKDIPVDPNDMMLYQLEMGNIQDLMPYLNDSDRDFIMTGITEEEWKRAFVESQ